MTRVYHAVVLVAVVGAALYAMIIGPSRSGASDDVPRPVIARTEVMGEGMSVPEVASSFNQQPPVVVENKVTGSIEALKSNAVAAAPVSSGIQAPINPRIQALNLPTPTPVPPKCEPSDSPIFCIYTVQPGDTLSHVAQRFGLGGGELTGWELLAASNKPDITSVDDFIQPGQKLRVPNGRGIVHTAILDESLDDLSDVFQVDGNAIVRANAMTNDSVATGQVVLIPDPKRLEKPPPPQPTPEPVPTLHPDAGGQQQARRDGFIWPINVSIRITNYMGPRHPLGIDMGLSHAPNASILAVAPGKVTFAGGNACCSYGLYVIVEHDNGLRTLYAHLSRIEVSVGERVAQGQRLGPAGTTGYSTGVHLHFEVHKNGERVDPMLYLP